MKKSASALIALLALLVAPALHAESVDCSDDSGSCTMDGSSVSCECATGVAMDSGGSGEAEEPTQEDCEQALLNACQGITLEGECDSNKGACIVFSDGSSDCICAAGFGDGEDSSSGSTGEDPVDDPGEDGEEEVLGKLIDEGSSCEDVLAEECPNDPPDPAEYCTAEDQAACENLGEFYEECYEETVWPFMIVECCEMFEEDPEGMGEMADCLDTAASCEAAEESCFDSRSLDEALYGESDAVGDGGGDEPNSIADGDDSEEGDDNEDGDGSSASSDDDGSGCTSIPTSAAPLAFLGLLGLVSRRRRD